MKPRIPMKKTLSLLLLAALSAGSYSVFASPDDDDRGGGRYDDDRGSGRDDDDRGSGRDDDEDRGGGSGSADALSADFVAIPPTAGRGDGHYFPFSGGENIALNADVRLALEKLDEFGNTLKILNTHLGITRENASEAVITLFIGTDEDGDGSCLSEGPTSMCVLEGGGSHDEFEINPDGILHTAWAMALREDGDDLRGSGICWTDFDSTAVIPQFDENGTMTSVVFDIEGGEEAMPEIIEGDGCMVGFGAPWLGFDNIDCEADSTCQVIPIMNGLWED